MTNDDESTVLAMTVERLGKDFPDRSRVEIATAVVDAWDHVVTGRPVPDPDGAERSARSRLSAPA